MTTAGDLSAEGHALDYRETVDALTEAMPTSYVMDGTETDVRRVMAQEQAADLARAGFVLVRMEQPPGLARPEHQAASEWFGRTEDV